MLFYNYKFILIFVIIITIVVPIKNVKELKTIITTPLILSKGNFFLINYTYHSIIIMFEYYSTQPSFKIIFNLTYIMYCNNCSVIELGSNPKSSKIKLNLGNMDLFNSLKEWKNNCK